MGIGVRVGVSTEEEWMLKLWVRVYVGVRVNVSMGVWMR